MFKIGDQVTHFEYGGGEVVHLNGEMITVTFDNEVESAIEKESDHFLYTDIKKSKTKEVLSSELEKVNLRLIK